MTENFFDAESYQNNPDIELAWAGKAIEHMEVHFNLITSVDPRILKLTPYDNEIYEAFQNDFPDFKLDILDEESLKSTESKKKWHDFCLKFREKMDDATFGTLVRIDSSGEYNKENTIFVLRIQFLAIEIARNRKGLNDSVYKEKRKVV
ncbi:protein PBDC1-like [Stegodyphus dumicola]|uniref:protein PBDC1-like n=1 Tax=Stegodyphus dumicola TaxID=202533 RepID=UPI0015AFE0A6|nr:protein PBDC1-like [Stegodyphus dumicola]